MVARNARKTVVLCLVLFCLALLAAPASAVVIPVAPANDGVFLENDGMPFSATSAGTTINTTLWGYEMFPGYYHWQWPVGVVKIPIGSLAGMDLTGASITLNYYVLSSTNSITFAVWGSRYDGDGSVSLTDYDRMWGYGCPERVQMPAATGTGWHSLDVAAYIRDQQSRGYSWANFYLAEHEWNHSVTIAAAEDTQGRGAYLEVTPVPEPSSLMALGGGLLSIAGLIRRRK